MAIIKKLDILSPQKAPEGEKPFTIEDILSCGAKRRLRVYFGMEGERLITRRDEGPMIILHTDKPSFETISAHIHENEFKGINHDIHLKGAPDESNDYFSGEGARELAKKYWDYTLANTATLHLDKFYAIHIRVGEEPNSFCIWKQQRDPDNNFPPEQREGTQGTRKLSPNDITFIAHDLQKMGFVLPKDFEATLREHIPAATPKRGAPAIRYDNKANADQTIDFSDDYYEYDNVYTEYSDIPGKNFTISYDELAVSPTRADSLSRRRVKASTPARR